MTRSRARPGKTLSVRIDPDRHAIAAAADARDVSMAWLVNRGMRDFLARLIPVDQIEWTRRPPDSP